MAEVLNIESLDLEARGIARREGKVVFVEGALPGERVAADIVRRKPSYEIARTVGGLRPSAQRVTPRCAHFGVWRLRHAAPGTRRARLRSSSGRWKIPSGMSASCVRAIRN